MITDSQRDALLAAAQAVRSRAYAPYSDFPVGAAVLAEDGQIYSGANVENASYGLSMCAERTAVGRAVAAGVRQIMAVAVASQNGCTPCGACRQVLAEFAADVPVWLSDADGRARQTSLRALLPDHFGPEQLAEGS